MLEWFKCQKNLPTVVSTETWAVSEIEFGVTVTYDDGHINVVKVLHNKEDGWLTAEFYDLAEKKLVDSWYMRLHKSPSLRFEMWADKMNLRRFGNDIRAIVQETINIILGRVP